MMTSTTDNLKNIEDNKEKIIKLVGKEVYYLALAKETMIKESSKIDLGKLFATPNEYIQKDWINENTNLNVKKREADDGSNNGDGYDLITEDELLTIQSKLRSASLHLECTRRMNKGGKNDHAANDTGSVRYKVDEADVFIFTRPLGFEGKLEMDSFNDVDNWDFVAIPATELEDPKARGYCYTTVPKRVWRKYVGHAAAVLKSEYQKKKSINE